MKRRKARTRDAEHVAGWNAARGLRSYRGTHSKPKACRLMRDLLYEIKPLDPAVFAVVAATLLAVAAFACIVPAWRRSRVACIAPRSDTSIENRIGWIFRQSPGGTLNWHIIAKALSELRTTRHFRVAPELRTIRK